MKKNLFDKNIIELKRENKRISFDEISIRKKELFDRKLVN